MQKVYPSEINLFIYDFLENHLFRKEFQAYLHSIKQIIFLCVFNFYYFSGFFWYSYFYVGIYTFKERFVFLTILFKVLKKVISF